MQFSPAVNKIANAATWVFVIAIAVRVGVVLLIPLLLYLGFTITLYLLSGLGVIK